MTATQYSSKIARRILVLAYFLVSCSQASEQPGVLSASAWSEDIDFLTSHLAKYHIQPFSIVSKQEFLSAATELKEGAATSTDAEMVVGIARLVASIGDAHTYLQFANEGQLAFGWLPVTFNWFDDGVVVAAATAPHRHLVGARVVSIGETPIEQALWLAAPVLYQENAWTGRISAVRVLARPDALQALGISDSNDRVQLLLELRDGSSSNVMLDSQPSRPTDLLSISDVLETDEPLYLRNRDRAYWHIYLENMNAHYVQFNQVRNDEQESIVEFSRRLDGLLTDRPTSDVILDLRWNVGGDSAAAVPLLRVLVAQQQRAPETNLFVVTGRWSLSATIVMLGDLIQILDPVIVGEPTGARPNLYGENPFTIRLPNSALTLTWATQYFQAFGPGPQPEAVMPDIAAPPTVHSFLAGDDPALLAIQRYTPYDLADELQLSYDSGGIAAALAVYEDFRSTPEFAFRESFDIVRRFGRGLASHSSADTLQVYEQLRANFPKRARSYELLGSILHDLGRHEEALENYTEALRLLSADQTVSRPLAYALEAWLDDRIAELESSEPQRQSK